MLDLQQLCPVQQIVAWFQCTNGSIADAHIKSFLTTRGNLRGFCSVVVCMQNVCLMPRFQISPVTTYCGWSFVSLITVLEVDMCWHMMWKACAQIKAKAFFSRWIFLCCCNYVTHVQCSAVGSWMTSEFLIDFLHHSLWKYSITLLHYYTEDQTKALGGKAPREIQCRLEHIHI